MTRLSNRRSLPRSHRPGFMMLVAMVLLMVITGLSVAWARRVVLQKRQTAQRLEQTQAEWLATSAVQRALSQLAADPKFKQDFWSLSPADLQSEHGAAIEIRIQPGQVDNTLQLEVLVDYPNEPHLRHRVRRVQQVVTPTTENL